MKALANFKNKTKEVSQDAAIYLLAANYGHRYGDGVDEWMERRLNVMTEHPFRYPDNRDGIPAYWVGDTGVSASGVAYRRIVLQELFDPYRMVERIGITIYQAVASNVNIRSFDFMPEVALDEGDGMITYILASGFTNYSGEGGSAWAEMNTFLISLANVFNVRIETVTVAPSKFDAALKIQSNGITRYNDLSAEQTDYHESIELPEYYR